MTRAFFAAVFSGLSEIRYAEKPIMAYRIPHTMGKTIAGGIRGGGEYFINRWEKLPVIRADSAPTSSVPIMYISIEVILTFFI